MQRGIGTALGDRYRLQRELGAGGMATVYLADDLRHQRQVAVKVLRPEVAESLGAERFLREITTTANLRHPHILPLFDSGEADGHLYYVMPYAEGESLRDRLEREHQLPLDEALRLADEVADALQYAHGRGVVHRDIKPDNILLENGRAVVADFGIASAVSRVDAEKLTVVGMALGTPHYMSPEQASGDEVDARSDLYALACVLYEMLVGAPPYTGSNAMQVLVRHATEPVPSLRSSCPSVSAEVAECVERALAKAPHDRFDSVSEWRQALRSQHGATGAPRISRVAFFNPPPTPATPLLGREEELTDATARLADDVRLLTILGVGGTGKTRFAMQLFHRLQLEFPDGAAFVSLASVTAPEDVIATIGSTLAIAEAHGRTPLEAAITVIGDRCALLILDNCEQVLGAAADIAQLLARCENLVIIATSRAPLKISAETEYVLAPLALPGSDEDLEQLLACASVALFVQRAEKVKPGFALTDANAASVVAICRQLDGLPLAIELAAARVRTLEPKALLQRLDHALDLLTSGDRDLPLRQRTLRATISWSFSLLEAPEQRLLRRLSVFHEGWTLEAMEQVCVDDAERWRGIGQLDSLVEKGLVRVLDDGARYTLLETIRAFSAEQLHAAGEVEGARTPHITFFVELMREVRLGIVGSDQLPAMQRWRADVANVQAALGWALTRAQHGDAAALEQTLLLCGTLSWPWHIAGLHLTGQHFVDTALALATDEPPSAGRALSYSTRAVLGTVTADWTSAGQCADRGLDDARTIGDDGLVAELEMLLSYVCMSTGRMEEAAGAMKRSISLAQTAGLPMIQALSLAFYGFLKFLSEGGPAGPAMIADALRIQERIDEYEGRGVTLSFLAQVALASGDQLRGFAMYRAAEAAFARVGDKPEVARVQGELAWASLATGAHDEALSHFFRSLRSYVEVGSPRGIGQALLGLAVTRQATGDSASAVRIAAAAAVLSASAGVVVEHPMVPGIGDRIAQLRSMIPAAAVGEVVESGQAPTLAEIMAQMAA
jgi:predicted ATPase/tRNA A-37 threonylcarbamoyl transferase component Bud32